MDIGGVRLNIKTSNEVRLAGFTPPYSTFANVDVDGEMPHPTVGVAITCALQPPVPVKERKIFDCGTGWKLFKDSQHYCFVWPMASGEPSCIAWTTHDFDRVDLYHGRDPAFLSYPLDQILLMHILALHQGAIVHSAGIEYGGACHIFPGVSGAGKSTLSRLLAGVEGLEVLSDDRMIVRKIGDGFRAYGTPWPGDAGFAVNRSAPLKGIFFLTKAAESRIQAVTPAEALTRLLPVASIPWYEKEMVTKMLDFCDSLLNRVPAYDLRFTPDGGVAQMLLAHMDR
jgi:hypothetical protein